jgi:hypothetical protein
MENQLARPWRTSSYSGNGGGNCVEVASNSQVFVRDSQDISGPVLQLPPAAWHTFAASVKAR